MAQGYLTDHLVSPNISAFFIDDLHVVEDINMVDTVEDWSQVRSPARARRRRAKYPQRIVMRQVPKSEFYRFGNKIIMHPAMAAKLRNEIPEFRP